jgi:hypothetical protein
MLELHKWLDILVDPQWQAFVGPNLTAAPTAGVLNDIRAVRLRSTERQSQPPRLLSWWVRPPSLRAY